MNNSFCYLNISFISIWYKVNFERVNISKTEIWYKLTLWMDSFASTNKMLYGEGKFINRPNQTGGKLYDKFFVYVPTEVARDGLFPFKIRETVKVRIDVENNRLIIEKLE